MQLCKSALLLRWVLSGNKISYGSRRFASLSRNPLIDDSDNFVSVLSLSHSLSVCVNGKSIGFDWWVNVQVLVEGKASSRTAILNRPSSLNALNTSMVSLILV